MEEVICDGKGYIDVVYCVCVYASEQSNGGLCLIDDGEFKWVVVVILLLLG